MRQGDRYQEWTYEGILGGWFVGPMCKTDGCIITEDFVCAYTEHVNPLNLVRYIH